MGGGLALLLVTTLGTAAVAQDDPDCDEPVSVHFGWENGFIDPPTGIFGDEGIVWPERESLRLIVYVVGGCPSWMEITSDFVGRCGQFGRRFLNSKGPFEYQDSRWSEELGSEVSGVVSCGQFQPNQPYEGVFRVAIYDAEDELIGTGSIPLEFFDTVPYFVERRTDLRYIVGVDPRPEINLEVKIEDDPRLPDWGDRFEYSARHTTEPEIFFEGDVPPSVLEMQYEHGIHPNYPNEWYNPTYRDNGIWDFRARLVDDEDNTDVTRIIMEIDAGCGCAHGAPSTSWLWFVTAGLIGLRRRAQ